MKTRMRFMMTAVALLLSCVLSPSSDAYRASPHGSAGIGKHNQSSAKSVVYVCACLKTRSCACMTEAKMQGPCACGTEGGPPMKAVPSDSDWAKQNREALAQP